MYAVEVTVYGVEVFTARSPSLSFFASIDDLQAFQLRGEEYKHV